MGRSRKREASSEALTVDDLRESMRNTRDLLVFRIKKGYGDERNRMQIEKLREEAERYKRKDPAMWREICDEGARDPEDEP